MALAVWRSPELADFGRALARVDPALLAAALAVNIVSVGLRGSAWHVVVRAALPPPPPRRRDVVSAYAVSALVNAALPGRIGELARVATLSRRLPRHRETWAAVLVSCLAHRIFDVFPLAALAAFVVAAQQLPAWAEAWVAAALGIGAGGLLVALVLARPADADPPSDAGMLRRLVGVGRHGLAVLREPLAALEVALVQGAGWCAELVGVWLVLEAFGIEEGWTAAAVALLVMTLVLSFPLWPGAVGLLQAAVALALVPLGVGYTTGFAYGIGLQAVEVLAGIATGAVALAREGLSLAALQTMTKELTAEMESRDHA